MIKCNKDTLSRITIIVILIVSFLFFIFGIIYYNGYIISSSNGISMCPSLGKYSIIIMKKVYNASDIISGNIYVYQTFDNKGERHLIQHRYLYPDDNNHSDILLFKGDNNQRFEYVYLDSILYEVVYDIPIIKCNGDDINAEC